MGWCGFFQIEEYLEVVGGGQRVVDSVDWVLVDREGEKTTDGLQQVVDGGYWEWIA